ncbi:uncharacterized protein LOC131891949 isoform X2 [Tigriopus californicus]|nr:uncharacterized protein LOC131891949 isoform X2 [Tigriopus californicus]
MSPKRKNIMGLLKELNKPKPSLKRKLNSTDESDPIYPLKRITLKNPRERERLMRLKLMDLLCKWNNVMTVFPVDPRLIPSVLAQSQSGIPISNAVFKSQMMVLQSMLQRFVKSIPEYQSLCEHDQAQLWSQNGDMVNALVLAKCLSQQLPLSTKIWWLLLCMENSLDHITKSEQLQDLSQSMVLKFEFRQNMSTKDYNLMEKLIQDINSYSFSTCWLCFITYACVFQTTPNSRCQCDQPDDRVNFGVSILDIVSCLGWKQSGFLTFLENLKEFSLIVKNSEMAEKVDRPLIEPFSYVEQMNVTAMVTDVANSFRDISMGPDMVQEMLMMSLNVPTSKRFHNQVLMVWHKRFHVIMNKFENFFELDSPLKETLVTEGMLQSLGMLVYWLEFLKCPWEQANFILGGADLLQYKQLFASHKGLKPTPFKLADFLEPGEELEVERVQHTVQSGYEGLRMLVNDWETFCLVLLFVLFQPAWKTNKSEFKGAGKLSSWFETILIRKTLFKSQKALEKLQMIDHLASAVNYVLKLR